LSNEKTAKAYLVDGTRKQLIVRSRSTDWLTQQLRPTTSRGRRCRYYGYSALSTLLFRDPKQRSKIRWTYSWVWRQLDFRLGRPQYNRSKTYKFQNKLFDKTFLRIYIILK